MTKNLKYKRYIKKDEGLVRSNIKSEFAQYNDIKNGNVDKVKDSFATIKETFNTGKGTLSDDPLKNAIYHFVVSAGIISRVCIDAGLPHDDSYTLSDIYIRKADKCKKPDEIVDLLCEMQLDFACKMRYVKKESAISAHIRNSIDYIYDHLHEPITMEQLAKMENLNPNYFSKLFYKETGQTTKAYILNAKIATAQNMLVYSNHSLSDISLSLGFSSQSAFCAAFKKLTGLTPLEYKKTESYKELMSDNI